MKITDDQDTEEGKETKPRPVVQFQTFLGSNIGLDGLAKLKILIACL